MKSAGPKFLARHFVWKFTGKNAHGDITRAILLEIYRKTCRTLLRPSRLNTGPLTLTARTPSVWTRRLGNNKSNKGNKSNCNLPQGEQCGAHQSYRASSKCFQRTEAAMLLLNTIRKNSSKGRLKNVNHSMINQVCHKIYHLFHDHGLRRFMAEAPTMAYGSLLGMQQVIAGVQVKAFLPCLPYLAGWYG